MKLNRAEDSRFKEYSQKLDMSFAAVVQGYMIEETLRQLELSSYRDVLWFSGRGRIGQEDCLDFYYVLQKRKYAATKAAEGQFFTEKLLSEIAAELFPEKSRPEISWETSQCQISGTDATVQLTGTMEEMSVPVELRLHAISADEIVPQRQQLASLFYPEKTITLLSYPAENILADNFVEIMKKLELISDMDAYAKVNKILKEQSVSGRTMIEYLEGQDPLLRKEKRLEQLRSYQKYAYMRNRWDKYKKHHKQETDSWEEVMQRILDFAEPLWRAFCRNEIFLDDWMPELGRFLM